MRRHQPAAAPAWSRSPAALAALDWSAGGNARRITATLAADGPSPPPAASVAAWASNTAPCRSALDLAYCSLEPARMFGRRKSSPRPGQQRDGQCLLGENDATVSAIPVAKDTSLRRSIEVAVRCRPAQVPSHHRRRDR